MSTELEQLKAQLDSMKAENHRLKNQTTKSGPLSFRVSEKGAISVYGLGRFPVTLYKEQMQKLGEAFPAIMKFISDNADKLTIKEKDSKDKQEITVDDVQKIAVVGV
jgi:hypothetical protein